MRKWMISLLSVMALSLTFSGCGESGSATSTSNGLGDTSSVGGTEVVIDNGDTTDTTITNEFGINPSLGTPPPLPAS